MKQIMMVVVGISMIVSTDIHGMSKYTSSEVIHYMKRHLLGPISAEQLEAMTADQIDQELSYYALLAFKQFEIERTKPKLDQVMRIMRFGASVNHQICLQEKHVVKRFFPIYLTIVTNSFEHTKELLQRNACTGSVWSIASVDRPDRPFGRSALEVAQMWCDDSGEMKRLIRSYEAKRRSEIIS